MCITPGLSQGCSLQHFRWNNGMWTTMITCAPCALTQCPFESFSFTSQNSDGYQRGPSTDQRTSALHRTHWPLLIVKDPRMKYDHKMDVRCWCWGKVNSLKVGPLNILRPHGCSRHALIWFTILKTQSLSSRPPAVVKNITTTFCDQRMWEQFWISIQSGLFWMPLIRSERLSKITPRLWAGVSWIWIHAGSISAPSDSPQ